MTSLPSTRAAWFPAEGEESAAYAVKHRTAGDLRAVIERLVSLDVEAVAPSELDELATAARALRELVVSMPDRRRFGSLAGAPLPDGALVERSPVSGRGNALAMPLSYEFDGGVTRATCVFSAAYEGPPGGVHGGYVAAAFAEVLGVAQVSTGAAGFTGTLTVRYTEITPIEQRIDFTAKAGSRDGRKLTMHAQAHAGSQLVAEAEGLFIVQVDIDDDAGNVWARD